MFCGQNSLWSSEAIWWQRSWSTLAQIMACCLAAPSHYLNQFRLRISEVLWQSPESNFTVSAQTTILYNEFETRTFEITITSPGGEWVHCNSCLGSFFQCHGLSFTQVISYTTFLGLCEPKWSLYKHLTLCWLYKYLTQAQSLFPWARLFHSPLAQP